MMILKGDNLAYRSTAMKDLVFHKKRKSTFVKFVDPNIQHLEKSITDKIGLNVSIKNSKKNKGTITFSYHDIEQLNKIIEIIKSNY